MRGLQPISSILIYNTFFSPSPSPSPLFFLFLNFVQLRNMTETKTTRRVQKPLVWAMPAAAMIPLFEDSSIILNSAFSAASAMADSSGGS